MNSVAYSSINFDVAIDGDPIGSEANDTNINPNFDRPGSSSPWMATTFLASYLFFRLCAVLTTACALYAPMDIGDIL